MGHAPRDAAERPGQEAAREHLRGDSSQLRAPAPACGPLPQEWAAGEKAAIPARSSCSKLAKGGVFVLK